VLCVYCAIGQRASGVAKVIAALRENGAMDYTIVVVTEGNDPPGLAYIAPYAATSIAEYFMEQGRDVLIIYDDLTHHARAYRELSLLLRRPPGREAFPGDIFYIHSRLLERATHLRPELGGGSLTALPIIETDSAGYFRLHSNQPDFHHGWADIPLAVVVRIGRAARSRRRQIRFARRWQGATRGLPCRGGRSQACLCTVRGAGNVLTIRRPAG